MVDYKQQEVDEKFVIRAKSFTIFLLSLLVCVVRIKESS